MRADRKVAQQSEISAFIRRAQTTHGPQTVTKKCGGWERRRWRIVVGTAEAKQTFYEKKDLLVKHSPFFAAALEGDGFFEASWRA
ncbi:unnamed protein product [Vitrella brassicaformis CCMP3155]|uniref:BTB domain-containing protein n=1 Tax=Vitrella brassicaformis (strain CCMP3155) TaxID=1169540 RepID=A0A0G4EHJ8_VITBC|nr:unnamed protein product [Vitrella brassicaformis CCMP3155]|eukprot:CEL95373.1 unnamed protein product [Vitrella brassicaformis CCMP3155]